jgi:hypothetical protein
MDSLPGRRHDAAANSGEWRRSWWPDDDFRGSVCRSGGVHIAYRVFGDGSLDLVLVPAFTSHLEQNHEWPGLVNWNQRLASFSRLVVFDKQESQVSVGGRG